MEDIYNQLKGKNTLVQGRVKAANDIAEDMNNQSSNVLYRRYSAKL